MMLKAVKKHLLKPSLLKSILIFILSYFLFLFLWLLVKDYYAMPITSIASHLVTLFKNLSINSIEIKDDLVMVEFLHITPNRYGVIERGIISVGVKNLYYTFNVPLTLAVMAAFYPYVHRKRVYLEVLLILVFIHILFVFTFEAQRLSYFMMNKGFENMSGTKLSLWNFFHAFVGSMVIRFESFLIGVYLYFSRNRGVDKGSN